MNELTYHREGDCLLPDLIPPGGTPDGDMEVHDVKGGFQIT